MPMFKTHKDSVIIQFHHDSPYGKEILNEKSDKVILQIETVPHQRYDFIAEVVDKNKYYVEEANNAHENIP